MNPFSIACTTCKVGLKVTNEDVLGEIVPCPKCGSMVLVPETHPTAVASPATQEASNVVFEELDRVLDHDSQTPDFSTENIDREKWKFPRQQDSNLESNPPVDAPTMQTLRMLGVRGRTVGVVEWAMSIP